MVPGVCAAFLLAVAASVPPPPARHFTDHAHLVSVADADRLDAKLREVETRTTIQMVVAVFPELPAPSLEDFTARTAQAWRVGQARSDNGIVLFVFARERRSRLEVGYGLEDKLPDVVAKRILEDVMAPRFRQGQYAAGLEAAIDSAIGAATGTRPAVAAPPPPPLPASAPSGVDYFGGALKILLKWILWVSGIALVLHLLFRKRWSFGSGLPTSDGASNSSSDGGFSGDGGSFGGGGASGRW